MTNGDLRECDKAFDVMADVSSDQKNFRKEVKINHHPFINFSQQCMAVLEDEEQSIVNDKTLSLEEPLLHVRVTNVIKIFIISYAIQCCQDGHGVVEFSKENGAPLPRLW